MKKLSAILAAGAAAGLAGTALAADRNSHVMNVPLPDGSIARVEYVGDVPPRVTVTPAPAADGSWIDLPSLASFDGMFERMNRQMHQIEQMARQPAAVPGMNVASYGNLPAGADSVSVITVSNDGTSCTRTTEVVSQGAGKPPKVTTNVSGNCGPAAHPVPQAAPGRPINHT